MPVNTCLFVAEQRIMIFLGMDNVGGMVATGL